MTSNQITPQLITKLRKSVDNPKTRLATRAATTNGIDKASENNALSRDLPAEFSLEIETSSVTNQKKSGRCWLFATLNQIRHQIEKDLKIERVELSETYNYFFDKLEKANRFCELVIRFAKDPIDSRENCDIFDDLQHEGGFRSHAANLIKKYGVVPIEIMPESKNTEDSWRLNSVINRRLRRGGVELREACAKKLSPAKLHEIKNEILHDIYKILVVSLGQPPTNFTWQYRDKDKKFHRHANLTPQTFREKFVADEMLDYVEICNSPAVEFGKLYGWRDNDNIAGQHSYFANVEIDVIEKLILKQLKVGTGVPFYAMACRDMPESGYMSPDAYDFANLFDVSFVASKADRIRSYENLPNHAMVITGVNIVDAAATAYKVENSWGEEKGRKGFYTMSRDWARENLWGVVIRRDLLPVSIAKIFDQEPIILEPWQQM